MVSRRMRCSRVHAHKTYAPKVIQTWWADRNQASDSFTWSSPYHLDKGTEIAPQSPSQGPVCSMKFKDLTQRLQHSPYQLHVYLYIELYLFLHTCMHTKLIEEHIFLDHWWRRSFFPTLRNLCQSSSVQHFYRVILLLPDNVKVSNLNVFMGLSDRK